MAPPALPDIASDAAAPRAMPRSLGQQAFDDGWAAMRRNDFTEAANIFERAVAVTSEPHVIEDATFWRAVALARKGEVVTAAHVLTAYLRAYPDSARTGEARVVLGWLLLERGDLEDARRSFLAATADGSQRVRDAAQHGLAAVASLPHANIWPRGSTK
ncbi:MAG: tetratricopeptide repeat protein [Myxococcales bacterium]|nr:tetratricopeptide repeat protein [Myxococcales bacterium]